jgi:hypothetical protein
MFSVIHRLRPLLTAGASFQNGAGARAFSLPLLLLFPEGVPFLAPKSTKVPADVRSIALLQNICFAKMYFPWKKGKYTRRMHKAGCHHQ